LFSFEKIRQQTTEYHKFTAYDYTLLTTFIYMHCRKCNPKNLGGMMRRAFKLKPSLLAWGFSILVLVQCSTQEEASQELSPLDNVETAYWQPVPIDDITDPELLELTRYGKDLIVRTAYYLGPEGIVSQSTNGLNCQNCHLDAGTRVYGNNYGSVASQYPKFRGRSGQIENLYKRVNDCLERSLNGQGLDTNCREMQAIVSYIQYIGSNVPKGTTASGSGLKEIALLDRPADPERGKLVYELKCLACHQANGSGLKIGDSPLYLYPPMWGENSYNVAAGLYRISTFARFVKYNMPLGATHDAPQLSDEEAWDVAAYVNSQVHPHKDLTDDWPNIALKPMDHPFGPFADPFDEKRHKFGPYQEIIAAKAVKP
jgi:thiosulfate dehydrogenase